MKVCQIQCSLNTLKNTINYYQKSITFQSFLFRIHTDFIISEIMNINTSKDYKQKHCEFPDLDLLFLCKAMFKFISPSLSYAYIGMYFVSHFDQSK